MCLIRTPWASDAAFDSSTAGQWTGTKDCKIGQCFRIAENHNLQSNSKQACNMQGPFWGTGFNKTNWGEVVDSYPHVHGSPVVWKKGKNDFNLYVWPEEDYLKAYHFDGRTFLKLLSVLSALDHSNDSMPAASCRSHGRNRPQTGIIGHRDRIPICQLMIHSSTPSPGSPAAFCLSRQRRRSSGIPVRRS